MNRSKFLIPFVSFFLVSLANANPVWEVYRYVDGASASAACNNHRQSIHPGSTACGQSGTISAASAPWIGFQERVNISDGTHPLTPTQSVSTSCNTTIHNCTNHIYDYDSSPGCPTGTEPDPTTGECLAPPPSCDLPDDYKTQLSFDNWYLPSTQCVSDCRLYLGGVGVITGSGNTIGTYHNSGEQCTGSEGVTNTINDGGTSTAPPPTSECPWGYVQSSMGCVAWVDDEDDPVSCPVGYFPDANGKCWLDVDGTETGQAPTPTGPYTGGPTSTAPGSATGSTGGSQGEGGGTQSGGQYPSGSGPTEAPGEPGSARGGIGSGSGDDEGTGTGSGAASASCEQAPTSQGDAQLDAILRQQWETMCRGHKATVSGTGDCVSDFKCDGDPMQCIQLEYERMKLCAVSDRELAIKGADQAFQGQGFLNAEQVEANAVAAGYERHREFNIGEEIDVHSGTTTGSCPADIQLNLGSIASVTVPLSQFCMLFTWAGIFVRISASLVAFRMLFGTVQSI